MQKITNNAKKMEIIDDSKKLNDKKVCIIGSGNGGRAFAAYLANKNYQINLGFRTINNIKTIIKKKEIISEGELSGKFKINKISSDYNEIIEDSKYILVVLPANTQINVIKEIVPSLKDGQIILLNPGRTWGAVHVYNEIIRQRFELNIYVAETQTLYFTCRKIEDYGVSILKIKDSVNCCFYPIQYNPSTSNSLSKLLPNLKFVNDIRITSLNNIGAVVHPATVLLNSGSISRDDEFLFYREGVTKPISKVIEMVDNERIAIMNALDIPVFSFLEWVEDVYGIKAKSYHEAFQQIPSYSTILAPQELKMRYLTEEIPTGLVPLSSIGKYLRVPTPNIDALIDLADTLLGTNYRLYGRSARNVGLPLKLLRVKNKKLQIASKEMILI